MIYTLTDTGDRMIPAIKALRASRSIGLAAGRDMVLGLHHDDGPIIVTAAEAAALRAVGCTVTEAADGPQRRYYAIEYRAGDGQNQGEDVERRWPVPESEATLISSEVVDQSDPFGEVMHSPAPRHRLRSPTHPVVDPRPLPPVPRRPRDDVAEVRRPADGHG